MNFDTARKIDFEFTFGEIEAYGNLFWMKATSQEGLDASLATNDIHNSHRASAFLLDRNEEILDKSRLDQFKECVQLALWVIDHRGKEIFFLDEFSLSEQIFTRRGLTFETGLTIPRHFWSQPGKRVKISLWLPSALFLEGKSEPEESIPLLFYVPAAPNPPEIEEFQKTSMNEALMSDRVPTDFTLVSEKDGKEVKCHQCILYISGEFFQKIIENCLDPGKTRNSAKLPFSGRTLELIKKYIYRREISLKETDEIEEIVDAATMLMFPCLVSKCENYIMENLDSKDKYDMLVLARRYDLENLKAKILPLAAKDDKFRRKMRSHNDFELVLEYTEYLADKQ